MRLVDHLDVNQVELRNAVIQNLATAPVSPAPIKGQIYYDTTLNKTGTYNGTAWVYEGSDASLLAGQSASYYLDRANHTGTQAVTSIAGFDTAVQTNRLDQMAAPTAAVSMGGQILSSVANPVNGSDAVNKSYADALASTGLNKGTARVVSLLPINVAVAPSIIDGVNLAAGDVILIVNQSLAAENGLYAFNVPGTPLTRATNADTNTEVQPGLYVFISEGIQGGNNGFTLTTDGPIVLDTTPLTFTQISGAGQIEAGAGLQKTGNTINIVPSPSSGLIVVADLISIDFDIVPQISGNYIGDGTATSFVITHGLSNQWPIVNVYEASAPFRSVLPTIESVDGSSIRVKFARPPAANEYAVAITG